MYDKNTYGYYKNRHSCFLLSYHLVLVTKYRKPVLADPEVQLLDLVRVIKTKSSRFCRSRHKNEVAKYHWKPYFWSDSYFITSIGDNTRMIVQKYIQNQGSKN